jgi:membrane-associated phospholipid phosphatase
MNITARPRTLRRLVVASNALRRIWLYNLCNGIALLGFLGFALLGLYVGRHGEPGLFLIWERELFNHSTLIAWWLTWGCYPKLLVPICLVLLVLAWRFADWRARILLSIASLLTSWCAADYFQRVFARPRPLEWVVKHETSFSYPSSHATIAVGFYILWAILLYASSLPKTTRSAASLALVIFVVAICWSRVALGAHYLTDLLGGALLGLGIAFLTLGILVILSLRRFAGRVSQAEE